MSEQNNYKRVLRVGDEIATNCGRCKDERTHQIVALGARGNAERVVCRTCQSSHLYREEKTGASVRVNRARGAASRAATADAAAIKTLRPYSLGTIYEVNQWINHPKFGEGKVTEVKEGGKITVQFGRDQRTLLHAGQ